MNEEIGAVLVGIVLVIGSMLLGVVLYVVVRDTFKRNIHEK